VRESRIKWTATLAKKGSNLPTEWKEKALESNPYGRNRKRICGKRETSMDGGLGFTITAGKQELKGYGKTNSFGEEVPEEKKDQRTK